MIEIYDFANLPTRVALGVDCANAKKGANPMESDC